MQMPLQIVFNGVHGSTAVYRRIEERVAKLERHFQRMVGCKVVVEKSQKCGHQKALRNLYDVRIEIQMPGDTVVVERQPIIKKNLENMYLTIKYAFDTMERRLREFIDRKRQNVKTHYEMGDMGTVAKLWPDEQCGFLLTSDGREIYFHENSVIDNKYSRLEVGKVVRFVEEQGEEGPQASSVILIEHHRRNIDELAMVG